MRGLYGGLVPELELCENSRNGYEACEPAITRPLDEECRKSGVVRADRSVRWA